MTSPTPRPKIRLGPAGWSYPDWRGIVYPARKPKGFDALDYLAQFFDTVEINTSFYNPPRPEVVERWLRHVEHHENFEFTAKLWQRFTHDRSASPEDERLFKQGIEPLAAAGRLGALLIQFPWSFKNNPGNRQYLTDLCARFKEFPIVIEVRHASWNTPETLAMLQEIQAGFCNIDQPVIGRSLGPTEHVSTRVGYVRLHGRNYQEWFSANDQPTERYNYLYSLDELSGWVERIKNISQQTRGVFVIANNHFRGQAVANALQLTALVSGKRVKAPELLIEHYPELSEFVVPVESAPPTDQRALLFGECPKKS